MATSNFIKDNDKTDKDTLAFRVIQLQQMQVVGTHNTEAVCFLAGNFLGIKSAKDHG